MLVFLFKKSQIFWFSIQPKNLSNEKTNNVKFENKLFLIKN